MITLANGWKLRTRQEEVHDKIIAAFNAGHKEFLFAANCRFGKTLTTLSALNDYAPADQLILIVSTMSVKNEWKKNAVPVGYDVSLLDKEVNDINFDSLPLSGRHVIYCSTQKLGNESDKSEDLIKWFNRHVGFKTIIYDECHLGSGTDRTKSILERLDYTNQLYLSGTPYRKHLKSMFGMDTVEGKEKIYMYSIMDERDDYKNGIITDYTPVQLEMHVLDYAKDIDTLVDGDDKDAVKYGVSSAYFKKIFSDANYKSYAEEFLNKILDFAADKNIKTFLFFVPLKKVGNDIVKNFEKKFKDKIEFRNLCGDYISDDTTEDEDEANLTVEAEKLSAFYKSTFDGRIKIGITCNKCGTGITLEGLDAVAFLKDTTQAIPFIQKSQRVRTPEDGKTIGYCLCFNQWQGLKAFCDYARATSKKDDSSEKDAVKDAIENGAVKLVLNLEEVKDYSEIIDILNVYKPGQYPLFDEFDFDAWPDETFAFLNSVEMLKAKLAKEHPELRNDSDFEGASTLDTLKKALKNNGLDEDADDIYVPTYEEMREMLEDRYVGVIREFFNYGYNADQIKNVSGYDETDLEIITTTFGTEDVWKFIIKTYPRYVTMVLNYLSKKD